MSLNFPRSKFLRLFLKRIFFKEQISPWTVKCFHSQNIFKYFQRTKNINIFSWINYHWIIFRRINYFSRTKNPKIYLNIQNNFHGLKIAEYFSGYTNRGTFLRARNCQLFFKTKIVKFYYGSKNLKTFSTSIYLLIFKSQKSFMGQQFWKMFHRPTLADNFARNIIV